MTTSLTAKHMKPFFSFYFFLLLFANTARGQAAQPDREMVFRSVNVVPMDQEGILPNRDVRVKGGKIIAIAPSGKETYGHDVLVIDGRGRYLMPGLAEMHAHVPPVDNLEPMKEVLSLFALNGITTIRGMLGHPRHLELRQKLQQGEILGPRFITSGPSFNGQSVKTPEGAAAMVRQQKEAGYDFLKIHPGLTKANFDAVAKTAKSVGIPFGGHVPFDVGVWQAAESGILTIDHMDGFVEALVPADGQTEQGNGLFGMFIAGKASNEKLPALIATLQKNKTWVVPTQALAERWFTPAKTASEFRNDAEMKYMPASTLNSWVNSKTNLANNPNYSAAALNELITLRKKLILACHQNGVGLLLGSDAPQVFNVPGFSTHQELEYLVAAGLTPFQALQTGTVNVGRFLNNPGLGLVKAGAVADLLLLSKNPLENIAHTKSIEGVLLGTVWLPKAAIEEGLKKLEKEK